jgi:hypothetical protein
MMQRKPKTSAHEWERKRFCGQDCRVATLVARNRLRSGRVAQRLTIPESSRRVISWDGVPAQCSHCRGLWKRIDGGVSCLTCGRDLYVASLVAFLPG